MLTHGLWWIQVHPNKAADRQADHGQITTLGHWNSSNKHKRERYHFWTMVLTIIFTPTWKLSTTLHVFLGTRKQKNKHNHSFQNHRAAHNTSSTQPNQYLPPSTNQEAGHDKANGTSRALNAKGAAAHNTIGQVTVSLQLAVLFTIRRR